MPINVYKLHYITSYNIRCMLLIYQFHLTSFFQKKQSEICPKIAIAEPASNIKNNHLKTNPYEILTHFMMKLR